MASIKFDLIDGLVIGDETHKSVTLRSLTAGDIEDAALESERVIQAIDGPVIVTSPVLMSSAILRRQIVQIGNDSMALSANMLRKLSSADLELIQAQAQLMDAATRKAVEVALMRGRSDEATSGDKQPIASPQ